MTHPVLSQDELDALREEIGSGDAGGPTGVDLTESDRILRKSGGVLDRALLVVGRALNDFFSKRLPLPTPIEGSPVEMVGPQALKEAVEGFGLMVGLHLKSGELAALIGLDRSLCFLQVEVAFGAPSQTLLGDEEHPFSIPDRGLTAIEHSTVQDMGMSVGQLVVSELLGDDIVVKIAPYGLPPEPPQVQEGATRWSAQVGPGRLELILLPTVVDLLVAGHRSGAGEARPAWVLQNIAKAQVEITALLGGAELPLQSLLALREGDVLRLDRGQTDALPVMVEGQPMFGAVPVQNNGVFGVEIKEVNKR